jgi:membrane protein DedA with SNARE-associated domain
MHWRSFVLWNALGGICWATGIGLLAYFLGNSASNAIETFGIYGLVAAVVAIASAVFLHRRAHRRSPSDQAAPTPRSDAGEQREGEL